MTKTFNKWETWAHNFNSF